LYRGEDYVLSIDSHMRFRSNWDAYLIQQLLALSNHHGGKAVLTTYPVGYQLPNRVPNETRGTLLEPWKFDGDGMFRQKARFLAPDEASSGPVRTHLFAAGFNFAGSSLVSDCPYQNLPHLFFGEEISMAVRLFVVGYDLYAPAESVCYHLWTRSQRPPSGSLAAPRVDPAVLEAERQRQRSESMAVVQAQLTRNEPHATSSSGVVRDVSEFGAAIGVDFCSRTIAAAQRQPT
jgi:[Skp1-protein]-hydroxyproline N-acetylglucosaminyltransferase